MTNKHLLVIFTTLLTADVVYDKSSQQRRLTRYFIFVDSTSVRQTWSRLCLHRVPVGVLNLQESTKLQSRKIKNMLCPFHSTLILHLLYSLAIKLVSSVMLHEITKLHSINVTQIVCH